MSSAFNIRNQNQFRFSDLTANLKNLKFIDTIELGYQPDKTNSGAHSIAIGSNTGINNQGTFSIAIGYQAGQNNQGSNAIALGTNAGQNQQKPFALAIGDTAGQYQQKDFALALGTNTGQNNQGTSAIAIGSSAGFTNQRSFSVAIGTNAGQTNQGSFSVAIGTNAGQTNQGSFSVAIGTNAGQTNQGSNSIILNASGNSFNANASGLYIKPIRNMNNSNNILLYKPETSEIIRQPFPVLIGDLKYSLSNIDHNNWLLCDGRSLNINVYPQLFELIGYSFGGSGNVFHLPDPRSRSLGFVGQGSGLSIRTLGEKVGSETHNVDISELPIHNHTLDDPGHLHSFEAPGDGLEVVEVDFDVSAIAVKKSRPINTSGSSTTGIIIDPTGGGQSYSIFQPTLFIGNIFIYTDQ